MRGRGAYHLAKMKGRDERISALCSHLRAAIDLLEDISQKPIQRDEAPPNEVALPIPRSNSKEVVLGSPEAVPEKLAFTMKQASKTLGIGLTTLYKAMAHGDLKAVKVGNRTLITRDALDSWLATLPQK